MGVDVCILFSATIEVVSRVGIGDLEILMQQLIVVPRLTLERNSAKVPFSDFIPIVDYTLKRMLTSKMCDPSLIGLFMDEF